MEQRDFPRALQSATVRLLPPPAYKSLKDHHTSELERTGRRLDFYEIKLPMIFDFQSDQKEEFIDALQNWVVKRVVHWHADAKHDIQARCIEMGLAPEQQKEYDRKQRLWKLGELSTLAQDLYDQWLLYITAAQMLSTAPIGSAGTLSMDDTLDVVIGSADSQRVVHVVVDEPGRTTEEPRSSRAGPSRPTGDVVVAPNSALGRFFRGTEAPARPLHRSRSSDHLGSAEEPAFKAPKIPSMIDIEE